MKVKRLTSVPPWFFHSLTALMFLACVIELVHPRWLTPTAAAPSARRYEGLAADDRRLVKETYRDLLAAHERKDFSRMQEDSGRILALVDDYNDTKAYSAIADRGLHPPSPQAEAEARDRKLREVAALEIQGDSLVKAAVTDAATRAELYHVIDLLLAADPGNTYPQEWRERLRQGAR